MNIEFKSSSDLIRTIRRYSFTAEKPSEVHDQLQTLPGVDADVITRSAELLYAHFDTLDDEGLTLCACIFLHMNEQNFVTAAGGPKGSNNRAEQIIERTQAKLKGEPGLPEDWPEPQAEFRGATDWRETLRPEPEQFQEAEPIEETKEPKKGKG